MPNNKLSIALALIALILLLSCDDDINPELEKLPPATQIGANTCGCLVNGKAWVSELPKPDTMGRVFSIGGYTNWFAIPFKSGDTLSITSRLWPEPRVTGIIHDVKRNNGWAFAKTLNGNYHSSVSSQSNVSITFSKYDITNFIMSGSFYMKLHPADSLKDQQPVLEFTNCRFDFQFWHP